MPPYRNSGFAASAPEPRGSLLWGRSPSPRPSRPAIRVLRKRFIDPAQFGFIIFDRLGGARNRP
jgi:hypothetical protein